jgi:dTDP-4-dehydrorhamnose reductase
MSNTSDAIRPVAWVTGAGGMIGSYLMRVAPQYARGWEITGLTRSDLDLTDYDAVRQRFQKERPGLVIHCAALTKTPVCQANPALAHKLNVEVTQQLVELAEGIPLFFFSSDMVFDGKAGNYDESAPTSPIGVYAETKVAAEKIVLSNPKHTVIRTSLNVGVSPTRDRGFNEQMLTDWKQGKKLRLFQDEFRCPIPAEVTAGATWELAAKNKAGLYHVAGRERLSRWQIGQLLAPRWPELNPQIEPCSRKEYQGAPRPEDTSMNCSKAQKALSFQLAGLGEWMSANPNERFES